MAVLNTSNRTERQSFGELGFLIITDTSNTITGEFCAITCLEDTTFDASGLVFKIGSSTSSGNKDAAGSTVSNTTAVATSHTFPKRLTIYGKFTSIALNSGKVLAYNAERH